MRISNRRSRRYGRSQEKMPTSSGSRSRSVMLLNRERIQMNLKWSSSKRYRQTHWRENFLRSHVLMIATSMFLYTRNSKHRQRICLNQTSQSQYTAVNLNTSKLRWSLWPCLDLQNNSSNNSCYTRAVSKPVRKLLRICWWGMRLVRLAMFRAN